VDLENTKEEALSIGNRNQSKITAVVQNLNSDKKRGRPGQKLGLCSQRDLHERREQSEHVEPHSSQHENGVNHGQVPSTAGRVAAPVVCSSFEVHAKEFHAGQQRTETVRQAGD